MRRDRCQSEQDEELARLNEWSRLVAGLRERFNGHDVRWGEAEAAYGTPSIVADRSVLCDAPADQSGWGIVDCHSQIVNRYVPWPEPINQPAE